MENSDISLSLFYSVHENSFKIKTNLKEDKINEILFDCYRTTLNSREQDYSKPKERDIYNIHISLDLSEDKFCISSNTGNKVLAYELIRESINRWEIVPEEMSLDKNDLEEILTNNMN